MPFSRNSSPRKARCPGNGSDHTTLYNMILRPPPLASSRGMRWPTRCLCPSCCSWTVATPHGWRWMWPSAITPSSSDRKTKALAWKSVMYHLISGKAALIFSKPVYFVSWPECRLHRNHPTTQLIRSIFGLHNSSRFETYCYALAPSDQSEARVQIDSECEHVVDISGNTYIHTYLHLLFTIQVYILT